VTTEQSAPAEQAEPAETADATTGGPPIEVFADVMETRAVFVQAACACGHMNRSDDRGAIEALLQGRTISAPCGGCGRALVAIRRPESLIVAPNGGPNRHARRAAVARART
jgi:hypothetical protein